MVGKNQVYALRFGNLQLCLLDSNRELPYLLQQNSWLEQQVKDAGAPMERGGAAPPHLFRQIRKQQPDATLGFRLDAPTTMPTLCSKGTNMPMPA